MLLSPSPTPRVTSRTHERLDPPQCCCTVVAKSTNARSVAHLNAAALPWPSAEEKLGDAEQRHKVKPNTVGRQQLQALQQKKAPAGAQVRPHLLPGWPT